MKIKEIKTTEYPTRHVAFQNPGVWCIAENPINNPGFEYACYYEGITNETFPDLEDGIHAEVCSYQGKLFLADCCATRPDKSREQRALKRLCETHEAAKAACEEFIQGAKKFCKVK